MELKPTDESILDALVAGRSTDDLWGRSSPGLLADEIGYSSEHVQIQLQVLEAGGYVAKLDRGIHEFTDQGVAEVE